MPAISAVAAAWAAIGSVEVAGLAIGSMIQSAIISTGIGVLASKLGIFKAEQASDDYGLKVNDIDEAAPILIVYGLREVGGNEVYRGVSGSRNQYFHRVMVISEGEIDGLEAVYLNDNDVDEPGGGYEGLVEYNFHSGTQGQAADSDLVNRVDDWNLDCRGFGVAYIYMQARQDYDQFSSGIQTLTVKVRGRKVYDPRTGETAWSQNPALCLRDYLTNKIYGVGIPETAIDDDSFCDEANYCDEPVTFKDSDGEEYDAPRYTCNGALNPDDGALENTERLLTSCRGMLIFSGGRYRLVIDKPDAAVFDFNIDNIVGGWSITGNSKRTILNQVRARFYDSATNWEESLTVVKNQDAIIADGNQTFEGDVFYPLVDELPRVNILAQHHLKQARQGLRVAFTSNLQAFGVEVGDVVTITHPVPGWNSKLFRITNVDPVYSDQIQIQAMEYDPSVYTFDILTPPSIPDTNLPSPFDSPVPSGLSISSGTEHLQVAPDGTVISRMLASWTAPPSSFVERYEVGYKLSTSSGWTTYATGELSHYFAPVADGYNYDVRVRAVYYSGRRSLWATVSGYTVVGKTEAPSAPSSFSFSTQRDYTREFSWTVNNSAADVDGYKIRYSTGLNDAWEDMTPLHIGLLVSSPWETNLLNAGTYRFAIKTVDTSKNESAVARYMIATLEDSPVSSIILSRYPRLEGWPGTITNGYVLPYGEIESTDPTSWNDLPADWDSWTSWGINGDDLTYQYQDIDLGAEVTFRPVLSAQVNGNITYEIDYSLDGSVWAGWQLPTGDITARYLRCRIKVTGTDPRIQSMSILLDGKIETEDLADVNTGTLTGAYRNAAGDVRLPIQTSFSNIKTVQVALQNTGPGWTWELIDKDAEVGPRIKIYDSTGTLADAVIDATIKGY